MGERSKAKSNPDVALKTRFGANVKNFRRRLGFSQEELAWRAAMHRTYLADIERGGRNISLFNIVKLVNALGTSLSEFFLNLENIDAPPRGRSRRQRAKAAGTRNRPPKQRARA